MVIVFGHGLVCYDAM